MTAEILPPPPVSRWPFRRVALVLAVTAFGAGIPTPVYALYESAFHISSGTIAAIFAAYTVGVLATMLLVAPLSDLVGRKPVLYLGMALVGASAILFLFANGVALLAIARVVSGLAVGATTSTATATMTSLEPRRDPHHVARVSVAANFGGVASGILLSGILVAYAPAPRELIYVVLIAASVVGGLAIRATPETVVRGPAAPPVRVQRLSVPPSIRRSFWVAAGALAACYSIYGYFAAIGPSFLRVSLSITNAAVSSAVIASMFGFAALVQTVLGQVRDRRALLVGLPIILGATFLVTLALPLTSLALFGVGAAILGIGVGYAYMGSVTLVDRVSWPEQRGEILSAFFVVGYLALAVPTIGVGATVDQFGLVAAASAFGISLAAWVAVLYFATRRTPTPPGGEGWPRDRPASGT